MFTVCHMWLILNIGGVIYDQLSGGSFGNVLFYLIFLKYILLYNYLRKSSLKKNNLGLGMKHKISVLDP